MRQQVFKSLHGYHIKNLTIIAYGRIRNIEYVGPDPIKADTLRSMLPRIQDRYGALYIIELDNGLLLRTDVNYLLLKSKTKSPMGNTVYQINTHKGEMFYTFLNKRSLRNARSKALNFHSICADPFNIKYHPSNTDAILARRKLRIIKSQGQGGSGN